MKVFHFQKYHFIDIQKVGGRYYYAFECVKADFDPEIVLVTQARVMFPDGINLYFDSEPLDNVISQKQVQRLCVNQRRRFNHYLDLAENESKRYDRRTYSEVNTLIHDMI